MNKHRINPACCSDTPSFSASLAGSRCQVLMLIQIISSTHCSRQLGPFTDRRRAAKTSNQGNPCPPSLHRPRSIVVAISRRHGWVVPGRSHISLHRDIVSLFFVYLDRRARAETSQHKLKRRERHGSHVNTHNAGAYCPRFCFSLSPPPFNVPRMLSCFSFSSLAFAIQGLP